MKRLTIRKVLLVAAVVSACLAGPVLGSGLRAWGSDSDGQVSRLPAGDNYTAVAAGDIHGIALRSDGTVAAWGQNAEGQCNVPSGVYKAVGAGADFGLAIRTDGAIAAWGNDAYKQVSSVPAGNNFVAVDGGEFFAVALTADGSIVSWGDNRWGQVSAAPKGTGFKMVVTGDDHAAALRSDGSLASWGYWAAIQGMPTSGTFTTIAAGGTFCLAVKSDGSLVWWGTDPYGYGLAKVPAGNDYVAVAAGYLHGIALKEDGSVVGWGAGTSMSSHPNLGQANPPAGNDYKAIACGLYYSLALAGEAQATEISDNFDDNKRGTIWRLQGVDLTKCWLDEVNRRLELRATAKARGTSAYYVGDGWQIDPKNDFSFKVDFHYGLRTDEMGWVSVGLTPDASRLDEQHVGFAAGCGRLYPHLWFEAIGGTRDQANFAERRQDDGSLYVSYDASLDQLYLSTLGYGVKNAWITVPNLLQAGWRGQPLTLYLGGGAEGLEIRSGDAYLDNFVVEASGPVTPSLSDVYRFWSPALGRHFYTIDRAERDKLVKEYSKVWTYEGPVFKAAATPYLPGLAPVYRFWSAKGQSHFYTIDKAERDRLIKEFSHVWTFEGEAFYAYPEGAQPQDSKPVYRFWRPKDNSHFYTLSPAERDRLIKEFSKVYAFEGVAFYAYE